jgi:GntR family transcriptional regulator of abcA and norABC
VRATDWKPNPASVVPLYKQITEFIKEKISGGEWPIGSKLPTQRELARDFEVNRSTVVTALDELIAEGLIEGKSGSGTKVIDNTWTLLATTPPPDWFSYVEAGTHQPNLPTIQEINKAEFYPDIIRLGTGELSPAFFPADMMGDVLKRLPKKINALGYEEPKGLLALRQALSTYLQCHGIHASPSSILIVSGAIQALQLISIGLLHRGSTIFLEKPSYLFSLHVFQSAGMKLRGIPLDEEGIDTTLISKYHREQHGALLYTIPSFHNPTGVVMTEKRREELLKVCEQERLPIIEDDVYRELWLDERPPKPLKAHQNCGLVLYLGSLSKTLSPGLRIGWMVGPEPVIERLADIKMQTDYGSSSLSQWAAAEWFSSGLYQEHLEQVRAQLKIRKEIVVKGLKTHFSDLATWKILREDFISGLKSFLSFLIGNYTNRH